MTTSTNERDAAATRAVRASIDELNAQLPSDERLGTADDCPVAGSDGLDSLSTVVLLTGVESALATAGAADVPVLDAVLARWDEGPMETVGSLSRFVAALLGDHA